MPARWNEIQLLADQRAQLAVTKAGTDRRNRSRAMCRGLSQGATQGIGVTALADAASVSLDTGAESTTKAASGDLGGWRVRRNRGGRRSLSPS